MSSAAWELVSFVEANGGEFLIDGEDIVIRPGDAAMPVLEELREHKVAIIALLQSRSCTTDPAGNLLDGEWMLQECAYVDRWWGGIGALHLSLARWSASHGRPTPASRRDFVTALQSEGFQVASDGLVYGLILKADLEAHLRPSTPERRTRKNNDYSRSKPAKCVGVPVKSTAILGSREKNEA